MLAEQIDDVQNRHHAAVAEDRRAHDPAHPLQVAAERLDDDFAAFHDVVDDQRHFRLADADDEDRQLARRIGDVGNLERFRQPHHRQQLAVERDDALAQHARALLDAQAEDLLHRGQRHRERLAVDAHDEGADDGEGEGQPDGEGGALVRRRIDADRAAQLLDGVADDVHADAAAGDVGHLVGGRQPLEEHQRHHVGVAERGGAIGREEAAADRLLAQLVGVEAAAVVADAEDGLRAFVVGRQPDAAARRLAQRAADVRRLEAVTDRVAQHVQQRLAHRVEHLRVELEGVAFEDGAASRRR